MQSLPSPPPAPPVSSFQQLFSTVINEMALSEHNMPASWMHEAECILFDLSGESPSPLLDCSLNNVLYFV